MPRGNFWEATYDPEWDGPAVVASLTGDGISGLAERVVRDDTPVTVKWKRGGIERHFQKCDFRVDVRASLISNCTFTLCRFRDSAWRDVKFSNCSFKRCDFSGITLERCHFVSDCTFDGNSASGELFRIEETAISASAFLRGLRTNLTHLPPDLPKAYQESRFVRTKQKIAKAIFSATLNEAELEFYYEANEQLARASLDLAVERLRFEEGTATRTRRPWFKVRSVPARLERRILLASGWLTNWGRSVTRSCVFLGVLVAAYAVFYAILAAGTNSSWATNIRNGLLEALNVSLVAGYTAYYDHNADPLKRMLLTSNLIFGLYWYSLVIPVVSRRTLR